MWEWAGWEKGHLVQSSAGTVTDHHNLGLKTTEIASLRPGGQRSKLRVQPGLLFLRALQGRVLPASPGPGVSKRPWLGVPSGSASKASSPPVRVPSLPIRTPSLEEGLLSH